MVARLGSWVVGAVVFPGLLSLAAGGDEGEAKAIAAIEKALGEVKTDPAAVGKAAADARSYDSPAVVEVMVKAFTALEVVAQDTDKQAHDAIEKGKMSGGEVFSRRQAIDPIRKAQVYVLERVSAARNTDALVWMVDHLLGDDKAPQSLKIEGMRAAVQGGAPAVAALQRALPRLKKQDDLVAFLLAVQMAGPPAKAMADPIVKLVDHPDATVREHAALALADIAAPQGIEPLIRRLEKEEGRTQLRFAAALEILTKQTLGASPAAWKSWFAAEGVKYTSGQVPLGGGKAQVTEKASGYFHGIAQDSRSIVYVVDVSGSMVVSLKDPKFEDPQQTRPIAAGPGEESRMSCSKKELIKALGDLPPSTKFDIVTFSTTAERYSPKLIEASPAAIKKAQKFVEELQPVGATNIYDAMESAFGLAGRGSADKFYDSGVDTIFLLTDGQPMLAGSRERDSTQRIEDAVRRMNPFKRITVHTIGLGNGIDAEFLQRIAADNGGTFVQR